MHLAALSRVHQVCHVAYFCLLSPCLSVYWFSSFATPLVLNVPLFPTSAVKYPPVLAGTGEPSPLVMTLVMGCFAVPLPPLSVCQAPLVAHQNSHLMFAQGARWRLCSKYGQDNGQDNGLFEGFCSLNRLPD